jgi:hypothetical protein
MIRTDEGHGQCPIMFDMLQLVVEIGKRPDEQDWRRYGD